jgi:antitoxin component YwqK of YwqJK toxin-antitoxin module
MRLQPWSLALPALLFGPCATLSAQEPARALDYGNTILERTADMRSDSDAVEMLDLLGTVPPADSVHERVLLRTLSVQIDRDSFADALATAELGIREQGKFEYLFHLERVVALAGLKRYDEALAYADICIKRYPASFSFPDMKARVVNESGDHARALRMFEANVQRFPLSAAAHAVLGNLALQEGKTAQAALCYSMALCVHYGAASDERHLNTLDQLLGGTADQKPVGLDLGKADDLAGIDLLLKNRVAMEKGYKMKPDLPYPMCRGSHLLFTYLTKNPTGDGFWSTFYVPFFKRLMSEDLFEGFVYNALANASNVKITALVKKKTPVITDFRNKAGTIILEMYRNYPDSAGGPVVKHWYGDDGNIDGVGEGNGTTGTFSGPWVHFHPNGALFSKGMVGTDGKRTGRWTEYYDNGAPKRDVGYSAGNEDGTYLAYHRTGALDDSTAIVDGKANGPYHHHAPDGTLESEKIFMDGKFTGPAITRFACNAVDDSYGLVDNKVEGPAISHYPDGVKQYEGTYSAGDRTGTHITWFHNGNRESEAVYAAGKANGPFTLWWPDGTVKEKGTRKDDLLTGPDSTWEANGALNSVGQYDDKGRSTGIYRSFDHGRPYMELEYAHDLLMQYRFFDRAGKVLSEGQRKKGKFQFQAYSTLGRLNSEGSYLDEGAKDGPWTEYFPDGTVSAERTFVKGVEQGPQREYFENGKLKFDNDYSEDDRTGTYRKLYLDGSPQYIGRMVKGDLNGTYRRYLPDSILVSDEYYVDGVRDGWQNYYDNNGRPTRTERVVAGTLREKFRYAPDGPVFQHYVVPPGPYVIHDLFPDGTPLNSIPVMNGTYHGKAQWFYPGGKVMSEGTYVNGKRDGIWTWYYENGRKHYEELWALGDETGVDRTWYRDGTINREETYVNGETSGPFRSYWPNGKVQVERQRLHGMDQGVAKNFAWDGTLQLVRFYDQGRLIGYAQPKADGSYGDTIAIDPGKAAMKVNYANGKPARSCTYRNGELDGPYVEYHPNGNVQEEETFAAGLSVGEDREYYPSGQLREVTHYKDGIRHGDHALYAENGKLLEQGHYNYGDLEGDLDIWDATGKRVVTFTYADGSIISMH